MISLHYFLTFGMPLHTKTGAPVAEWLGSLIPNQQAVTNVGSKLMCQIMGTCLDMTLTVERDVKQRI